MLQPQTGPSVHQHFSALKLLQQTNLSSQHNLAGPSGNPG